MTAPQKKNAVPRAWQPKFGMGCMLMVMFVFSYMGACGYYFMQYQRGGRQSQLAFLLFTLASPMILMVVVSVFVSIQRSRRKKK
jgi:Na+/melibiose symporter-like transporter